MTSPNRESEGRETEVNANGSITAAQIGPRTREEALYRQGLASDYRESAELLFRSLKYRDAAPLLRRALEEELHALADLTVGREQEAGEMIARLREDPHLARLFTGLDLGATLSTLEAFAEETARDPLFLYPSSKLVFRQLFADAARFLNRAERFVKDRAATDTQRRLRRGARKAVWIVAGLSMLTVASVFLVRRWTASSHGLKGNYFAGTSFQELRAQRVDQLIDFTWSAENPPPNLGTTEFSVRWAGKLKAPRDGEYAFIVHVDDGARLWIDDELLIDAWVLQAVTAHSGTANLLEGWHRLRLEYLQEAGGAICRLHWRPPGGSEEPIPLRLLKPGE